MATQNFPLRGQRVKVVLNNFALAIHKCDDDDDDDQCAWHRNIIYSYNCYY